MKIREDVKTSSLLFRYVQRCSKMFDLNIDNQNSSIIIYIVVSIMTDKTFFQLFEGKQTSSKRASGN